MIRSFAGVLGVLGLLSIGLMGVSASGQQAGASSSAPSQAEAQNEAKFPDRPELLRRIALYEAAIRNAETTHAATEILVTIYANLAALYEDAGMYSKSEDVMRREISVLRSGPLDELADAVGHLAVLHIAMGDPRQAEKDDFEALRIRESVGDPVRVALTWTNLAAVYVRERRPKKALDYAQKAMAVLADDPKVEVADRIEVRHALAYALCALKECGQAIPLLKEALALQASVYGADSLLVGTGTYLLGYTYWQNGEMDKAAYCMGRGTARMKVELGWGHTIYLNAMTQYAKFLRERGQMEAATTAEREIKMANAVVDARTLSASPNAFLAAGAR